MAPGEGIEPSKPEQPPDKLSGVFTDFTTPEFFNAYFE